MADPLAELGDACSKPKGDCEGRTHFVLHQTVVGNLTKQKIEDQFGGNKGKAHKYILKNGTIVELWPLDTPGVFATKSETTKQPVHGHKPSFALKGKLVHTEIDYEDGGQPTTEQYEALRDVYIATCRHFGRILTIVPHIEVDRGFADGHSDPQNFLYNDFYALLAGAGINMARVPRFDHERYWGKPSFKIPFDTDTFSWPPKLTGNPHTPAPADAPVAIAAVALRTTSRKKKKVLKKAARKAAKSAPARKAKKAAKKTRTKASRKTPRGKPRYKKGKKRSR
jgi:hypothetical protein